MSEIIFVYTVYCFLGGSELPVAKRSAGNIHTRVRAEAAHILIRNDGKLCRRAPHGFDNLAAGRAVISAVAPVIARKSAVIKRKGALFGRCLPKPRKQRCIVVRADICYGIQRIVMRQMCAPESSSSAMRSFSAWESGYRSA